MAGKFAKADVLVTTLHSNLDQTVIQITEDRLHLYLIQHLKDVEENKSWIAPATLLAAILTTFATTNFKDFGGFLATFWEAVFFLVGAATTVWLIRCLLRRRKAPTLTQLIEKMKPRSSA